MCVSVCVCVGSCLATEVFTRYEKGVGHHKVGQYVINRGQLPTNELHDINWDALDHATRAP